MSLLTGILSTTFVVINTIVNSTPLFVMAIIRVLLRLLGMHSTAASLTGHMDRIIDSWVVSNRTLFKLIGLTRFEVRWSGADDLSLDRWYMVVSNHRSWSDIFALQINLYGHIPPLKFFTKRQLLWIPVFGTAMWVLGFPYVRRMSREQIEANPALLEVDRQATLDACAGFKQHPTSALNFLEGTRFRAEKHATQPTPARFEQLLNPKVGGLTQVIIALEDRLHKMIDVTVHYPGGTPTFWEFMQGACPVVCLDVTCRDLPESVRSVTDPAAHRAAVADWVETLWQEKDQQLTGANGDVPERAD